MMPGQIFARRFLKLLRDIPSDRQAVLPRGAKHIWYADWQADVPLSFPFEDEPFVCILWNNRPDYVSEFLLEQLLQAKCTYLVIGGGDCEKWHDTADILHLDHYYPDFDIPDEEFVMTTWHEGEPLTEVLGHGLIHISDYKGKEFEHFLIVQIDPQTSLEQLGRLIDDIFE